MTADDVAVRYHDLLLGNPPTAPTVSIIVDHAGVGGRVLVVGAKTGRLAVALMRAGMDVVAVETSKAMADAIVERAEAALSAEEPPTGNIDIVTTPLLDMEERPGSFDVILFTLNSLNELLTLDRQRAALARARAMVTDDGVVLTENWVPAEMPPYHELRPYGPFVDDGYVVQARLHNPAQQTIDTTWLILDSADGVQAFRSTMRYMSVTEASLAAELAGFTVVAHLADWSRRPYSASSSRSILCLIPTPEADAR